MSDIGDAVRMPTVTVDDGSVPRHPIDDPVPSFYASLYASMCRTARECGYALTLHGSMQRDIDVVAVPWVESATSERVLIKQLCARHGLTEGNPRGTKKPHGRRATVLMLSGHYYVDLSVMPLGSQHEADQREIQRLRESLEDIKDNACWETDRDAMAAQLCRFWRSANIALKEKP